MTREFSDTTCWKVDGIKCRRCERTALASVVPFPAKGGLDGDLVPMCARCAVADLSKRVIDRDLLIEAVKVAYDITDDPGLWRAFLRDIGIDPKEID